MKLIAFITFTITAGPYKDTEITFREICSPEVLEAAFDAFQSQGIHTFAQCEYGDGPLTSMRPVARPTRAPLTSMRPLARPNQ